MAQEQQSAESSRGRQEGNLDGDDDTLIEKWMPTVEAIRAATRAAFPSSPRGPGFNPYWHAVFTRLIASVAADPSIPDHLTQPPIPRFIVNVFDHPDRQCCPCSLPDVRPSIVLERPDGVRKTDLVRGVRDFLYGAAAGAGTVRVYRADEWDEHEGDVMAEPLLYSWNWMSSGWDDDGGRVSYYGVGGDAPQVYAYACPVGEYEGEQGPEDTKTDEGSKDAE
ncbi:hypothetical protein F5144DRAFT_155454 [Chaetomium tenue]|uniref:Uncharacterized protein n=1 Tax=Chaetomium tenue TaxID=1854479 RepID=A0ACB7PFE4_9PEZI|nr:hypothetical protein F5144DRAFT_155454 [Chaetomium globosum]